MPSIGDMTTETTYPRVCTVEVLPQKRLLVTFSNGVRKVYDCKPLLVEEAFAPLRDEALFRCVVADAHGYGVVWSDEIDLAESELWTNGIEVEQPLAARR